jgi:hypothetical protein
VHPADDLRNMGYEVHAFNDHHFRVEGVFDFYIGKRGSHWWFQVTNERGHRPPDQIKYLVIALLGDPGTIKVKVPKDEFIRRLVAIGWSEKEALEAWNERSSKAV